jgi:hypothetical protein
MPERNKIRIEKYTAKKHKSARNQLISRLVIVKQYNGTIMISLITAGVGKF